VTSRDFLNYEQHIIRLSGFNTADIKQIIFLLD